MLNNIYKNKKLKCEVSLLEKEENKNTVCGGSCITILITGETVVKKIGKIE